ncbi:MAG: GntR family transcriptional regulator [Candidatus Korobacteraceae bacterium]
MNEEKKRPARPIGRRILREEIREILMEDILRGNIQPGERIVETRLAREFGVSQAPVREALRDLELLGFVVTSAFRGTTVRQVPPEERAEIYPIRAALEGVAARSAATRLDEAGLKHLGKLIDQMREAAANNDRQAQIDADIAFHLYIVEASGNRLLKQFWEAMRLPMTTFVTVTFSHWPLAVLAERHVAVLDALRSHDPATAEAAMRAHLEELADHNFTGDTKAVHTSK